jgi:hypothetical protein
LEQLHPPGKRRIRGAAPVRLLRVDRRFRVKIDIVDRFGCGFAGSTINFGFILQSLLGRPRGIVSRPVKRFGLVLERLFDLLGGIVVALPPAGGKREETDG